METFTPSVFSQELARSSEAYHPPISMLFLETLAAVANSDPDLPMEAAVLCVWGIVDPETEPTDSGVAAACLRILAISQDRAEKSAEAKPPTRKKGGFGAEYAQFLSSITPADQCIMASGFDVEKARKLYCEVDQQIADQVVALFLQNEWNCHRVRLEAAVYGAGGKMKSGPSVPGERSPSSGDHEVIDLTNGMTPEARAALREMGF